MTVKKIGTRGCIGNHELRESRVDILSLKMDRSLKMKSESSDKS